MFYPIFLISYLLFFTFLTWRRFHWGLILFFTLLPTYLIRFNLGPLPTTLLEVMIWIIFIIWLIKYNKKIIYHLSHIIYRHLSLFIAISLFLLAAAISIFTAVDLKAAAGEWKAFYVEPIIIFSILVTTIKQNNLINKIIFALVICGLVTSILAIIQHFTGWLVPYSFWQNQNTFRVTAWYGFPNAVGLFLAPLIPLAVYLMKGYWSKIKNSKKQETNNNQYSIFNILIFVSCILYLVSSTFAIIFAKSTGALVGLAAGLGFLLLIYKKTRWPTVIICFLGLLSLFSFSSFSGIKQELLLQDRSGQIRLSIWSETWQFLKDNPISGAGLASYAEKIKPYHTTVNGEGIEIFHHPHNIFLTMWVNLGLLGLVSFVLILIWFIKNCFQISNFKFQIFLLSSMLIIITMGLVDSPYIKNDLAIIFWLLPALLIISQYELEK